MLLLAFLQSFVSIIPKNPDGLPSIVIDWWVIQAINAQQAKQQKPNDPPQQSAPQDQQKQFNESKPTSTFNDVAGAYEAKEDLQEIVTFLKNPKKFTDLGAKIPIGVLLYGPPGTGKTSLARSVAGEANCPFINVAGPEFEGSLVGESAERVRNLFKQAAQKNQPCIIFIDEIDAIGAKRTYNNAFHGSHNACLNQLLSEMDGFQKRQYPIIVIGATNNDKELDPSLTRPGRFDRKVEVPLPDLKSRFEILKVHTRKVKVDPLVDLKRLALATPGFSGAELESIVNEATLFSIKHKRNTVTSHDFKEARDRVILGKKSTSMIISDAELKVTAFHEAGHALVQLLLPKVCNPLDSITIIPRGNTLGVTYSIPEREKYSINKEEIIGSIMQALGGRASEQIIFNTITTGAHSDLKKATKLIHNMVCEYGMSDIGYLFDSESQETMNEKKKLLNEYYAQTVDLLQENKDKLTLLANTLLKKETMHADEVYALLKITPRTIHTF